jgi:hypothetical protein
MNNWIVRNKNLKYFLPSLLVFAALLYPGILLAGTPVLRESIYDFKQIAVLSKGMERILAEKRVHVALIGRLGLNPKILPPGVNYSHAGFAVYSKIETSDGRLVPGYAVYNLYQGDQRTGQSFLAQDYPVDYLAVAQELKVAVVIPSQKLQNALLKTIFSDSYDDLHNPDYSALSNPFNSTYQNCTEFVLDVIFSAIYKTNNTRSLKANIAAYFEPHPILVSSSTLAMAARSNPDVAIDDHPGPVATATFTSIAQFLKQNGMADESYVYTVDPETLYGRVSVLDIQGK